MIFDIRYSRCIGNSCELTFPGGEKQPIDRSFPIVVFRVKKRYLCHEAGDLSFDQIYRSIRHSNIGWYRVEIFENWTYDDILYA